MGDFYRCIEPILAEEGGYVNHPSDPGGETNFGISKRAYPHLNIAKLTLDDALAIYQVDYWDKIRGDAFPNSLALLLLDTAVNMGPATAIKLLQRTLQVPEDGLLGNRTETAALNALPGLLEDYCAERSLRYARNPNVATFGRGWFRRLSRIHKLAIQWLP